MNQLDIYNTLTKPTLLCGDMNGDIHIPDEIMRLKFTCDKIFPGISKGRTVIAPYKRPDKIRPVCTKIIRNGPVTVVFWEDGTKTLVRRNENTPDDPYFAFCAALAKKVYGNNTRVKKIISENTVEPKERKDKE